MRTLFAGPYFGEFGHEVMGTGLLRPHARHFERVIVCSRPACAPLYEDIATEFRPHSIQCVPMANRSTGATMPTEETIQSHTPQGCEYFPVPNCGDQYTEPKIIKLGHYHQLGTVRSEWRGVGVVHARNRAHEPGRNWPQKQWAQLVEWILGKGIVQRLVCVGTVDAALMVEGCMDMRGCDLKTQMDIGASATFAVGPSSGWMHLASLCGCPHMTWVGGKEHVYVKRRYIDRWNPLRTRVRVINERTWQPEFATVRDELSRFMRERA